MLAGLLLENGLKEYRSICQNTFLGDVYTNLIKNSFIISCRLSLCLQMHMKHMHLRYCF